jgi:diaminopimelate epimerase
MEVEFSKYHALGNDFIVLEAAKCRLGKKRLPLLVRRICDRRSGVGADGVVYLSASVKADRRIDIYNADGSWAEKSGNGLRIAALHVAAGSRRKRSFLLETGSGLNQVRLMRKIPGGYIVRGELGRPEFRASLIPVKTRLKYVVNSALRVGSIRLPLTCVAVGNPHAVIVVDSFDFGWEELGAEAETAAVFPNGANIEFVKVIDRKKLRVVSWERGAGATSSSGTGAAASVAAMVMMGLADRRCKVVFEGGSLAVNWVAETGIIDVAGPVKSVMEGTFDFSAKRKP